MDLSLSISYFKIWLKSLGLVRVFFKLQRQCSKTSPRFFSKFVFYTSMQNGNVIFFHRFSLPIFHFCLPDVDGPQNGSLHLTLRLWADGREIGEGLRLAGDRGLGLSTLLSDAQSETICSTRGARYGRGYSFNSSFVGTAHTHTSGVTYSMAGDGEFRGCGYRGVASMECRSTLKLHNFKKQVRV